MIKGLWWKGLAGILLLYAVIVGFIIPVPMMDVTMESLRNVFYHVGMCTADLFLHFQPPVSDEV
jgi:heme exporter protein C